MKIRLFSDLHMEFSPYVIEPHDDDKDTILVLAGDVGVGDKVSPFLNDCGKQFRKVIYVLGNHEFWGGNIKRTPEKIMAKVTEDNVHLLNPGVIEIDGVVFVGSTLWTDMQNLNQIVMYEAQLKMNDYKKIRIGPDYEPWKRKLRPTDTTAMHVSQKGFMFSEIRSAKEEGKKVVAVSHHLPSYACIHSKYKEMSGNKTLDGAYASELFEDIADTAPDLWLFGHAHMSVDTMVADTRCVSNPRGYIPSDPTDTPDPNEDFDPHLSITI